MAMALSALSEFTRGASLLPVAPRDDEMRKDSATSEHPGPRSPTPSYGN